MAKKEKWRPKGKGGPTRARVKYKDRYYCSFFSMNIVQKMTFCKLEYNDLCAGCPHKGGD